jgi:protocatechuate 3,4-dioxygenase beta subunit
MQRRYLTLFLIAFPVFAQDRAAINGTVTDASGALVAGAAVELKSAETGLRRATLTDQGGRYQITPLPVGIFALTISRVGFRPTTVNHTKAC